MPTGGALVRNPPQLAQEQGARQAVRGPPSPEEVAARAAAKADHDSRTCRAVVSRCHIDGLKGKAV